MRYLSGLFTFCCLLAAGSGFAQLKAVPYQDDKQQLQGFYGKPSQPLKGNPGILILHAWMGIDEHSRTVAAQLSGLGYHTFIADIYGKDRQPATTKEAGEQAGYYKQHIAEYRERIRLAIGQLVAQGADPARIVVIGYCFGGLGAIEAARADLPVKGIVSFHGSYGRDPGQAINPIHPAMLILHGADDPHTSDEELRSFITELRAAKADWQMICYANAVHAFTDPAAGNDPAKGAAYNAVADRRSWQAMLQFLKELL